MKSHINNTDKSIEGEKTLDKSGEDIFNEESYSANLNEITLNKEEEKQNSAELAKKLKENLNDNIFDDEYYNECYTSDFDKNVSEYLTGELSIDELRSYNYRLLGDLNDDEINFIIEEYKKDLNINIFDKNRYLEKEKSFFDMFGSEKGKELLEYCEISCPRGNEYLAKKFQPYNSEFGWLDTRKKYKKRKDIEIIRKKENSVNFFPSNNKLKNRVINYVFRGIGPFNTYYENDEIDETGTIEESHIKYPTIQSVNVEDIVGSDTMNKSKGNFVNGEVGGGRSQGQMDDTISSMKKLGFKCADLDDMVRLRKFIGFDGKPLYFVTNGNHRTIAAKTLNIPKIIAEINDLSIESGKEKEMRTDDLGLVNDRKYRISKGYIDGRIIEDDGKYILIYTKGCFDGCCLPKSDLSRYVQSYEENIGEIDEKNMNIIQDMLNH